jgi:hypothetical protein
VMAALTCVAQLHFYRFFNHTQRSRAFAKLLFQDGSCSLRNMGYIKS